MQKNIRLVNTLILLKMAYVGTSGRGLIAALFYGVCSASMAFLNKAVINAYDFPFPFFIMACQMMVTVCFLELLNSLDLVNLPPYTWKAARMFLAPSAGYGVHATLSLIALHGMNIPMYGAVKRCTPLVNLVLAVVILRRPIPSFTLITSVLIITVGCFVAVLGDLTFDRFAYTMGGLSVLAQGLYLTLVQQCAENKLSTLQILHLNSYNTLAPFIVMSVIMGEPEAIVRNKYLTDMGFHLTFWTLVALGSVLNYSLFLCTALNSAVTTSLVSVGKSVIQTLVGFFVFGGVKYHPLNVAGITMNLVGGCLYSYAKFQDSRKKSFPSDENYNRVVMNGGMTMAREEAHPCITNDRTKDTQTLSEIKIS